MASPVPSKSDITFTIDSGLCLLVASTEVLQNDDILFITFQHLAVDPDAPDAEKREARVGLLSIAMTCKSFLEPGLNTLWRVIPSLLPLFRLLPSFGIADGVYVSFTRFMLLVIR